MTVTLTRAAVRLRLAVSLTDAGAIESAIAAPALPADLAAWLGRLLILNGVPYPYLVPDESMLPPESIRFFRLDRNWTAALLDGAFSIGRNLAIDAPTPSMALDQAVSAPVAGGASRGASKIRADALGVDPTPPPSSVSGFLLRSAVVGAYPGLGVNAYDAEGAPLDLLRMERLGTGSNVLIALIAGAAARVDIHEAPEHLHFGIDSYALDPSTGAVTAFKNVHPFTTSGDTVTIDPNVSNPVDFAPFFRTGSPRTMRVAAAAAATKATNSAELGFVMTEGVGLVSFIQGGDS